MTGALVPVATEAESEAPVLHVVFRVDTAEYAVPASSVLQLETYTGATPVPGVAPYVAGIVQLRGTVVPVIELRARFGLPPRPSALETRVVVVEVGDRAVALVADSAREVLRIRPSQLAAPPRLVDAGEASVIRGVAQLGDRTLLVLDLAALVGEEIPRAER